MAASIRVGSACVRNFLRADVRMVKQQIRQRWKWRHRGKSPEEAKTFEQRVAEMTKDTSKAVNIGFKLPKQTDLGLVEKESEDTETTVLDSKDDESALRFINDLWYCMGWSRDMLSVAQHYGLYRDLFSGAFFYPQFPLNVFFDYDSESVTAVYNGNILSPSEVEGNPQVEYDFVPDTLYTLALTAPDSHLQKNSAEYLHWLVGNIPGDDISKGEELCSYIPPFPVRGTGFHRYVFVLYKQEKKIDFHQDKRPDNCLSLKQRTFKTAEFYRRLEDDITPVSLAFFQSEWDESVTKTFWHKLDMKEPSFEFMHPPPYHPKQEKFPQGKPFNLYLDRYRDVKDINEEILKEKLKTSSLSPPPQKPKYPNIHVEPYAPSWLRLKNRHKRLREMHWEDLD
ncbi:39S ribosomal protein L38, mitochondrial-like [Mizuhopecten yessoensis]|uniref:Large ribosomal subunit protein mL38 n=1 Tax=Mizuhopecten yessoensis TaxID=6573 RepID=A0A210PNI8_MIZYE|nr:39S ribosomal protein L38, mitochondrial-like [Mizuhopecten yessoensis]OWF38006.1 39S ribosomal protein L38, mitochondrial [Mizuhopecten yessoensis]